MVSTNRTVNLWGPSTLPVRKWRSNALMIPAKDAESFGISKCLMSSLANTFEKILNHYSAERDYFILVRCSVQLIEKKILTRCIVVKNPRRITKTQFLGIAKAFNTMGFYVDNVHGNIENLWLLPKDTVLESEPIVGQSDKIDDTIAKSADGMPIFYG